MAEELNIWTIGSRTGDALLPFGEGRDYRSVAV